MPDGDMHAKGSNAGWDGAWTVPRTVSTLVSSLYFPPCGFSQVPYLILSVPCSKLLMWKHLEKLVQVPNNSHMLKLTESSFPEKNSMVLRR